MSVKLNPDKSVVETIKEGLKRFTEFINELK